MLESPALHRCVRSDSWAAARRGYRVKIERLSLKERIWLGFPNLFLEC